MGKGMFYGVRKGGQLIRTFTNHGDAVAFAADLMSRWWGALAVEWYEYDRPTPEGWEHV